MESIQINELRIGNWVDNGVGDNYIIDTSWFMDILNFAQVSNGKTDLKGIELTEEWLINLGYKEVKEDLWQCIENKLQTVCQLYYNDRMGFYYGNAISGLSVNYVHQLQNLYYALTDEELEIKK